VPDVVNLSLLGLPDIAVHDRLENQTVVSQRLLLLPPSYHGALYLHVASHGHIHDYLPEAIVQSRIGTHVVESFLEGYRAVAGESISGYRLSA
jgi:hypothetical protein